jgi:hypothetical protein
MLMSRIKVGDTVAFRRDVAKKCIYSDEVAALRAVVTEVAGEWLFLQGNDGGTKVMPVAAMSRVAPSGVILELV